MKLTIFAITFMFVCASSAQVGFLDEHDELVLQDEIFDELDEVTEDIAYDPEDEDFLNAEESPVIADPKLVEALQNKPTTKSQVKATNTSNNVKKK